MEKNLSAFDKTEICSSEIDHQTQAFNSFQRPSLSQNASQIIMEKEENKNSMENFCHQFYNDYSLKINEIITIKDLTETYKIKNRRVYELIGILQGLSFVYKLKKVGHYMWMGTQSKQYNFHFEQNRSVALKNVAGLLKLILTKSRQGLSIIQLSEKMMREIQEKTTQKQCKLTINRRIYQCLKVMKIMGMVEKQNMNFKLIKYRSYNKQSRETESLSFPMKQVEKFQQKC